MNMRTEKWNDFDVRFVERNGEWWVVMNDINAALNMRGYWACNIHPSDIDSINIDGKCEDIISELAIYERISQSDSTKARKFRYWTAEIMQKLRKAAGLEQFEILRMLDTDIQENIDNILDTLFYDEEKGKLMQSVTVANGDVDIIEF